MHLNKSFIYSSKNKNKIEIENLLNEFKKNYVNYRKNWHNQPKFSIQKNFMVKNLKIIK